MLRAEIEAEARRLGFARVRVAAVGAPLPADRFEAFVAEGRAADMAWLGQSLAERVEVRRLFPRAESVVVFSMDYARVAPPDPGPLYGRVACYAWGPDYHNGVLRRLRKIRARLQAAHPGVRAWVGVDAGPVWERAWAERAGLGWAGKNACAIVPGEGSYFFLAAMVLNVALPPDAPEPERCGSCTRCLDGCPTGAFAGPGRLDARRCLAWFTIEHDGPADPALEAGLGRWLFGCDDCQELCPHTRTPAWGRRSWQAEATPTAWGQNAWVHLPTLLRAPDGLVEAVTTGSPLRRAAPHRLKRNAALLLRLRLREGLGGEEAEEARAALAEAARHPVEWVRGAAG